MANRILDGPFFESTVDPVLYALQNWNRAKIKPASKEIRARNIDLPAVNR